MSLRSANFASLPVLTQDSQGPQTVASDQALTAAQILCISQVLRKVRIDHTSYPVGGKPASYYDLQSIDSDPPIPGTSLPAGYRLPVKWNSSASDLGQEGK